MAKKTIGKGKEEVEQITARPLKKTVEKLTEGARKRNLQPSTWYAKILDKSAKFETKEGILIIDKQILKFTYGDPKKVEEIAKEIAEAKFEEWKISEEEISRENFERRLREWCALSAFHIKVTKNNESIIYEVNHGIDKNWSKGQCLLNVGVLNQMGETVKNHEIRKLSWSITIALPAI